VALARQGMGTKQGDWQPSGFEAPTPTTGYLSGYAVRPGVEWHGQAMRGKG
jgi:hypothetical protein